MKFSYCENQCYFAFPKDSKIYYCVLDENHKGDHETIHGRKSDFWFKLDKQWVIDRRPKGDK